MNPDDSQSILELIQSSQVERDRVRALIVQKRWRDAEPDPTRSAAYMDKRTQGVAPPGAEAIVGDTIDLQPIRFLPLGANVRRAVAYVEVNTPNASRLGSGFLVSPNLFLSNCHVINDIFEARGAQITFDRELGNDGTASPTTTFLLEPEKFALFSLPDQLDYALVAVGRLNSGSAALSDFGFCALSDRPDKHVIGMNVNIVQHPRGWLKMIALRNNNLVYRTDRTLLYETDTEEGSSGSPVFNDDWELVALHHWAQPFLEHQDDHGVQIPVTITVNEGVRISAIYKDLQSKLAGLPPAQQSLLREVLGAAGNARVTSIAGETKKLSPPKISKPEALQVADSQGVFMADRADSSGEVRMTIPLEITVRLGGSAMPSTASSSMPANLEAPAKTLTRGAEAVKIDQDYSNRTGYNPDFIDGFPVPLPVVTDVSQIAPLRMQEPDFEAGELKYEHFSLKMNKSKRIALFTATNIDGATYLSVDRKTGQVSNSEGETWFKDIRISASYVLDQTFYSAWSTYFDRGHLTRRSDPTWGDNQTAARANADTFHFTNCSPQHFRFNQTTKFWQGVEQYVLEQGVLKTGNPNKNLCVFQGPIFDDTIDLRADDVQIPSSFWKIVVWKGEKALKAVGMVVDQLALLSEERKSLGTPQPSSSVNVSHWRVAISQIEKRTGLDFGKAVRKADTIATANQPVVGEEALSLIPINSLSDIVL
jgi:endonuclease G, mitochondrial